MSSITLSFALRTSSSVKTVHLIGSWDGYQGQLPLSTSKKGSFKGTFRFSSKKLQEGQRYWYYYQMDGYSVSHDPSQEFTVEPTTGRKLNILDVPASKTSSKTSSSRRSREVPRSDATCEIKSPKPTRPGQTRHIVEEEYAKATLATLTARFGQASIDDESDFEEDDESDCESDCSMPSLTSSSSRSSNCSTPSSVASDCSCERYGITRSGDRVKLDCGGERCGSDNEEECFASRRNGIVIR